MDKERLRADLCLRWHLALRGGMDIAASRAVPEVYGLIVLFTLDTSERRVLARLASTAESPHRTQLKSIRNEASALLFGWRTKDRPLVTNAESPLWDT